MILCTSKYQLWEPLVSGFSVFAVLRFGASHVVFHGFTVPRFYIIGFSPFRIIIFRTNTVLDRTTLHIMTLCHRRMLCELTDCCNGGGGRADDSRRLVSKRRSGGAGRRAHTVRISDGPGVRRAGREHGYAVHIFQAQRRAQVSGDVREETRPPWTGPHRQPRTRLVHVHDNGPENRKYIGSFLF